MYRKAVEDEQVDSKHNESRRGILKPHKINNFRFRTKRFRITKVRVSGIPLYFVHSYIPVSSKIKWTAHKGYYFVNELCNLKSNAQRDPQMSK